MPVLAKAAAPAVNDLLAAGARHRPVGSTPEESAAHIQKEAAKWQRIIKRAGIKPTE